MRLTWDRDGVMAFGIEMCLDRRGYGECWFTLRFAHWGMGVKW